MAELIPSGLQIAISQRRRGASRSGEGSDSLDDAWYRWRDRFHPGSALLPIPNTTDGEATLAFLREGRAGALILSGGEDVGSTPERDCTERAALEYARSARLPVIGVCRGMQFLHLAAGGALVEAAGHIGTCHAVTAADGRVIPVNSWHRWAIVTLAGNWTALATADDRTIEAMVHPTCPWLGMMFHPERDHGDAPAVRTWVDRVLAGSSPWG